MIRTEATVSYIEYSPSGEVTFVRFTPDEKFSFAEGQFVMIESLFNHVELGKPLKKPYSIATTNDELQTQGTVGVIVKKTMDGFMSEYLTKGVTVGTRVVLSGPFGHMVDKKQNHKYLLISTGSGVSPMVGLYQLLSRDSDNIIVNIFGERYHSHILPSVETLFARNIGNIKNILFLSQDDKEGYKMGHVQLALDEAIEFLKGNDITIFVCGSPLMVDDVRQMLSERGFSKEQIKYEKY